MPPEIIQLIIDNFLIIFAVVALLILTFGLYSIRKGGRVKTPIGEFLGKESQEPSSTAVVPTIPITVTAPATATANPVVTVSPTVVVNILVEGVPLSRKKEVQILANEVTVRMDSAELSEAVTHEEGVTVPAVPRKDPSWLHSSRYVVEKKVYVFGWGYGVLDSADRPNWLLYAAQGLNKLGVFDDSLTNDILEFVVFAKGLEQGHVYTEEQLEAMQKLLAHCFSRLTRIHAGPYQTY